jgi:hypothetical protein
VDELTQQQLDRLRQALHDWALADVKKAVNADAKVGAFILAANLVDVLARLAYSRKTDNGRSAWEEFIPSYLPRYHDFAEKLYRNFRCAISHNYSLIDIRLTDGPEQAYRHWTVEEGERVLHLESFVEELDSAITELFRQLQDDDGLRGRVLGRAADRPPLGIVGPNTGFPTASGSSSDARDDIPPPNATYWAPNIAGSSAASGAAWPFEEQPFGFTPATKPPNPHRSTPKRKKKRRKR